MSRWNTITTTTTGNNNISDTTRGGPNTDDTAILSKFAKASDNINKVLAPFSPDLIGSYDPMADTLRTSKPPKGTESTEDQKLDERRGAMCASMRVFYSARPWNALCGDRILSDNYNFGQATTGSEDLVPFCGPEASLDCSQGMGTAAQGSGGTSDSSEAIMDCDLVSWRAACLNGASSFNANPNDPGYNQRLYGRVPIDCYCACYDQCTMGQSSVLGLQQRTGATCTPGQLRAGKCREPSSSSLRR